jgi:aminobenzoyl-glutamate utilization protein B
VSAFRPLKRVPCPSPHSICSRRADCAIALLWSIALVWTLLIAICCPTATVHAADTPPLSPAQITAAEAATARSADIREANQQIWQFAELGLAEHRSSGWLVERLKSEGFTVETGLAGMPTSFVASIGQGQPVIAVLAEYDALPDLSQTVAAAAEPVTAGAPGHGCGHSSLGAGGFGTALAVKQALQQHRLKGTFRLYGTPAEETTIGKVYLTLAGAFDDVDVCLHWHPSIRNEVWSAGAKALISAKFTFEGLASHASGNPHQGRSALDGVELMNVGVNFMREHVREDARLHYVITAGGGAPNVVPAKATVWYFVRADQHDHAEQYFRWVCEIAEGAAKMSRTKVQIQIDTDCHELIANTPLSELMQQNLERLPAPKFTAEELTFAQKLQATLTAENGSTFSTVLDDRIQPLNMQPGPGQGSTDVGDISWHVPTCGLRITCFPSGSPGHCWQNVAAVGSSLGDKAAVYAAQVLSSTAVQLLEQPALITAAKADFDRRRKDRPYTTVIPKGQLPPTSIR